MESAMENTAGFAAAGFVSSDFAVPLEQAVTTASPRLAAIATTARRWNLISIAFLPMRTSALRPNPAAPVAADMPGVTRPDESEVARL
ncbi:hypothetical protein [Streptosporangium sp. NPDC004631]